MLFPKLAGASKTMTPSPVTRNADCHPLSDMTYTPPPPLLTAYPILESISQKIAFTAGQTGPYFCRLSYEDCAKPCLQPTAQSPTNTFIVFILAHHHAS